MKKKKKKKERTSQRHCSILLQFYSLHILEGTLKLSMDDARFLSPTVASGPCTASALI